MKIWSLTATDSSAGAGAFQDVSIAKQLLVSCEVVVIAITAQNSQGAQQAFTLPLEQIKAQWHSLQQDGWPKLIRLGWLPANPELLAWLVDALNQCPATVLWDPVLSASQGSALSQNLLGENCQAYVQRLLKRAVLITPNLNEARLLAGLPPSCGAEQAAKALQQQGAQHVLITGISAEQKVQDYFAFAKHSQVFANELPGNSLLPQFYMEQTRLTDNLHGTGCRFIASLACYLALGRSLYDSLLAAAALVRAQRQGKELPESSDDWPEVLGALAKPSRFKPLTKELGLYALVDNLAHLTRLLELGIDTLQWRVKTPTANYKAETQVAIERCRKTGVLLFINDDWQLALELGADGVHLGQEDLHQAVLNSIAKAGLYLG
ncbi:MAG: bifunctional hydroxymethylpyrimidine kinase/phosphomethylpyrimidine kinase, partial [Venatoribacter sp.]